MMRHWKGQADTSCLNQSAHTQTWCKKVGPETQIITTSDSKVRMRSWFWTTNSILNLARPFIILIL